MRQVPEHRTKIMGVVNTTPDSFSDGASYADHAAAVAAGRQMFRHGADIIDVGGESTRPGSDPVPLDVELARVIDVVGALAPYGRVSIDTTKAEVARAAVAVGASIINDVGGSLGPVAGELGVGYVAMHSIGSPQTMQADPRYDDVVADVLATVATLAETAKAAGAPEVWIDPGLGFGKTQRHNYTLIHHLAEFVATGWPVLVGASRKSFLGRVLADSDRVADVDFDDRLEASLAVTAWSAMANIDVIRVHDVAPTVQTLQVIAA